MRCAENYNIAHIDILWLVAIEYANHFQKGMIDFGALDACQFSHNYYAPAHANNVF